MTDMDPELPLQTALQAKDHAGGTEQEETSVKARPKVVRHSQRSTGMLKEWFASHTEHPYPSEEEKEMLAARSGLTMRQVSYWFVNARRRNARKSWSASSPAVPLPSLSQHSSGDWNSMTPLDRWRHTPPDQEGVSLSAITHAAQSGIYASSAPSLGPSRLAEGEEAPFDVESSLCLFDSYTKDVGSGSGAASDSSGLSGSSESATSNRSSHGKRRRRRRRQCSPGKAFSKQRKQRPYQCTFCTDTFNTRYDWARHEGTLHLVLEKWTCLLSGPTYCDAASENRTRCALCDVFAPSDLHIQSHKYAECISKPLSARIFYRKDHLRQHLRVSHDVHSMLPSMKSWRSIITHVKSRCGFCGQTFHLWSERNNHLAEHFRSGAQMKDWKGCHGLEPGVALLVENSMPPYLIGTEYNDILPFSASRVDAEASGQGPRTRFETLTARLGDYVKAAKESGVEITDNLLRREARLILYDDDDPWNQTPADNVQWLDLFKKGYGLEHVALRGSSSGTVADPSPFTLARMQQATLSVSGVGPPEACSAFLARQLGSVQQEEGAAGPPAVPWSWQTPECLAEFSQMGEVEQAAQVDAADDLEFAMMFSGEFDQAGDQTLDLYDCVDHL